MNPLRDSLCPSCKVIFDDLHEEVWSGFRHGLNLFDVLKYMCPDCYLKVKNELIKSGVWELREMGLF